MIQSRHYAEAGVDLEAGEKAVAAMKDAVRSTFNAAVLTDVGAFGGLFALEELPKRPVLVASTDGVGTKVALAAHYGRWRGIGHDIVHHCANDILVQGASPLFFLDYIASDRLDVAVVASIVKGIAEACSDLGCPLLGGETAEMPGVYAPGALDIAGTIVGIVERAHILPDLTAMKPGDRVLGLRSSGPHTNGYSLIRRLVESRDRRESEVEGVSIIDLLLEPHRCYVSEIRQLNKAGIALKGLAHITGGGIYGNLPRILPESLAVALERETWPTEPLFAQLCRWGELDDEEAFSVFNMGIGMALILDEKDAGEARRTLPELIALGRLVARDGERSVFWQ